MPLNVLKSITYFNQILGDNAKTKTKKNTDEQLYLYSSIACGQMITAVFNGQTSKAQNEIPMVRMVPETETAETCRQWQYGGNPYCWQWLRNTGSDGIKHYNWTQQIFQTIKRKRFRKRHHHCHRLRRRHLRRRWWWFDCHWGHFRYSDQKRTQLFKLKTSGPFALLCLEEGILLVKRRLQFGYTLPHTSVAYQPSGGPSHSWHGWPQVRGLRGRGFPDLRQILRLRRDVCLQLEWDPSSLEVDLQEQLLHPLLSPGSLCRYWWREVCHLPRRDPGPGSQPDLSNFWQWTPLSGGWFPCSWNWSVDFWVKNRFHWIFCNDCVPTSVSYLSNEIIIDYYVS